VPTPGFDDDAGGIAYKLSLDAFKRGYDKKLFAISSKITSEKTFLIERIYAELRNAVMASYEGFPMPGRKLPLADTGQWGSGLYFWVQPQLGVIKVWNNTYYAPIIEKRARPHFPPITVLAEWAQRKLGLPRRKAGGFAAYLRKRYSKYGRAASPILGLTVLAIVNPESARALPPARSTRRILRDYFVEFAERVLRITGGNQR